MRILMNRRRTAAVAVVGLIVIMFSAVRAKDLTSETLATDLQIAASLERAIRDSEKLGLFTKIDIWNRIHEVRTLSKDYRRGAVAKYDLKAAFNATVNWLDRIFAERDPALRTQLVEARTALWRIAAAR